MDYTCEDLTQRGGNPSGRSGSNYSAIHSALAAFKAQAPQRRVYYLNSGQRMLLGALTAAVAAFERSRHPHAALDRARKNNQIYAVSQLKAELDVMQLVARLSRALEPPYGSHQVALIRNSMEGWKQRLRHREVRPVFDEESSYVAMYVKDRRLIIDIDACEQRHPTCSPEVSLRAVLVHEYHHLLSGRKGEEAYHDEFVAHWKEFDVAARRLNKQERVDWINDWLLDHPQGYHFRGTITLQRPLIVNGPEETGHLWHGLRDNRG